MQILLPRRHPAPDVPLGFIHIQNLSDFLCQRGVNGLNSLRTILVRCRLTDPEFLRRLPHRRIIVYNILGDFNRPLFDITFQKIPADILFYNNVCGRFLFYTQVVFTQSTTNHSKRTASRTTVSPFSGHVLPDAAVRLRIHKTLRQILIIHNLQNPPHPDGQILFSYSSLEIQ